MLNQILSTINTIVVILVSTILTLQTIYFFSFLFHYKKYPTANKNHKYAIIICAHNEEKVIGNLIDSLKIQNYPKELVDIFVICHNCDDRTKDVCIEKDVKYFECKSLYQNERRKGYALKYAFEKLLTNEYDHEAYIMLDADNLVDANFIKNMNNAFDNGEKILQGFRNSKNLEDNVISEVNGIFHLRDSTFNNKARTLINSSVLVNGTGFLVGRDVLESMGGWNALTLTEDCEFSIQFILKGYKCKLVENAEFYDEQPIEFLASLNRQARIGRGVFVCFFKYGHLLLWNFIKTFKFQYLDAYINLLNGPISILTMLWFPAYYIYLPITMILNNQILELQNFLIMVVEIILLAIVLPVTLQNIIAYIQNRKRLNIKSFWKTLSGLLFFPFYNLLYALAITIGILTPHFKWKHVDHNSKYKIDDMKKCERI